MILHDLFDWTNAGVGVTGLVLTIAAIFQATGAKQAARQAREAVYRRNALDDVKRLERLASSLLTAIETEQYGLASHQSRDFISECRHVREHHRARLGKDGGKLDQAFILIRTIARGLLTGVARGNLIDWAQGLAGDMSGLAGVLSRETEEEQ